MARKSINNKRRQSKTPTSAATQKRSKTLSLDEHVDSSDDEKELPPLETESSDEEEDLETKKVRLAREYLQKIEKESDQSSSEEEQDEDHEDRLARKLQRDRLKREGTLERALADNVSKNILSLQSSISELSNEVEKQAKQWIEAGHVQLLRGHDLTPTCVAMPSDGSKAISGSKDHSVLLWDIEKACRIANICPHWKKEEDEVSRTKGQVLAVACSDDGRYAAVGCRDATVRIFDIRARRSSKNSNLIKTFEGHKGAVSSLCFRTGTLQLFSASEDRCIRHYNLEEMMYIETLYGHQFGITSIDCHRMERPVSVGKDRTARAWKLAEDTHLIFRGGSKIQAADSVSVIKDNWFLTGHTDGCLSLWMTEKKKSVVVRDYVHGMDGNIGRGIVRVSSLYGSDLAATGSYDGYLRFWKVETGPKLQERGLSPAGQIPIHGFVNDIAFGPKARFCAVAVGQEHKFGRWIRIQRAKNRLAIVKLQSGDDVDDGVEEDIDEAPEDTEESSNRDEESASIIGSDNDGDE